MSGFHTKQSAILVLYLFCTGLQGKLNRLPHITLDLSPVAAPNTLEVRRHVRTRAHVCVKILVPATIYGRRPFVYGVRSGLMAKVCTTGWPDFPYFWILSELCIWLLQVFPCFSCAICRRACHSWMLCSAHVSLGRKRSWNEASWQTWLYSVRTACSVWPPKEGV